MNKRVVIIIMSIILVIGIVAFIKILQNKNYEIINIVTDSSKFEEEIQEDDIEENTESIDLKLPKLNNNTSLEADRIHFLNVGSSDAILIESNGHYGLVDTSNPYKDDVDNLKYAVEVKSESVEHVLDYLKQMKIKKLDFIVGTHSHSDHIGGILKIVRNGYVDENTTYYYRTYETTKEMAWDNDKYYQRAIDSMSGVHAKLKEVTNKNISFDFQDYKISLLNTETPSGNEKSDGVAVGENKNSIVTLVTYKGKYKILLASDMEIEDEPKVAEKVGNIDILKIGHHGMATSSSISFLKNVKPEYAIITNKIENIKDYSGVATSALGYLKRKFGTRIFVTGLSNDSIILSFESNGYKFYNGTLDNDLRISNSINSCELKCIFEQKNQIGNWKGVTCNDSIAWAYYINNEPVIGWQKLQSGNSSNWYYFEPNAKMIKGWKELSWNNKKGWFHFGENGAMNNAKWIQPTKTPTGQNNTDKKWYYLKSGGYMAQNECLNIKEEKFCFDNNGVCTEGRGC